MQSAMEISGGGYFTPISRAFAVFEAQPECQAAEVRARRGRRSPFGNGGPQQRCARLDAPESLIKSDIVSAPTKTVELRRELILEFANFNMPVSYPGL